MYLCCLLSLRDKFPTALAQYSLFVLKVPLNPKQTNKTNGTQNFGIRTCLITTTCNISCSSKVHGVLTFQYRLTQDVLEMAVKLCVVFVVVVMLDFRKISNGCKYDLCIHVALHLIWRQEGICPVGWVLVIVIQPLAAIYQ